MRGWVARVRIACLALLAASALAAIDAPSAGAASDVGFGKVALVGESSDAPTTLQFGPDGRLYVGDLDGTIRAYSIERLRRNSYHVTATETIARIADIPNHDDDGTPRPDVSGRLVTGLVVVGTASAPVLYVSSSDPRFGGSRYGGDTGLDTNSGVVTRLRWDGARWRSRDLVRGLPRSEEVHAPNGLALDPTSNTLYVAVGGNTNMGAPSESFAALPEYALSGAIVSIDLSALGATPYDLPTLDDPARPGDPDAGDPFGGNDGANQARLVDGGPVRLFASGYRNPYDLTLSTAGRLYATDNGSNAGAGGPPVGEGGPSCTNEAVEGGISAEDSLHLVDAGDYAGHPNPTRANRSNTFAGQSPVSSADPRQCDWVPPGPERGSLATFPESTDGIDEYTASNFSGAMRGDLLLTTYADNLVYRVELNASGDAVASTSSLFSNIGRRPLDVTAQGDHDVFPGTIWVADHLAGDIVAFEPNDYGGTPGPCTGSDDASLDDDADGFSNADEIDNGTDPCSAGDVPPDRDGDRLSDRNDPDDDDDGRPDTSDPFAVDPNNGATTELPVRLTWDPGSTRGGLLDSGFTGLMTNGVDDYESLFDPASMTVGSATGTLTIDAVPGGTAHGSANTQRFGFQIGLGVDPSSEPFRIETRLVAPFAGAAPEPNQSMGLAFGTGGQDDYVELSLSAARAGGAVEFRREVGGRASARTVSALAMPGPDAVVLSLVVDPAAATVQPRYAVESGGSVGRARRLGPVVSIPPSWTSAGAPAAGILATSSGPAPPFPATWDYLRATSLAAAAPSSGVAGERRAAGPTALGSWGTRAPTGRERQEVGYSRVGDRFYLAWGGTSFQAYNPRRDRWRALGDLPADLDHIQTVVLGGKLYSLGGLVRAPGQPKAPSGAVWIYDPGTDAFSSGAALPEGRERGAGGVVAWRGRLYYFGGLRNGVAVPWVDVYDPVLDAWTSLPDMPRARDHFQAVIVGDRMYAIGGRAGDPMSPFGFNDAYDLVSGAWTTGLAPLPTPRGGYAVALVQGHILVIGGEGGGRTFSTVEAYDPSADAWRELAGMPTARHGIQAVVWRGKVFVAAGGALAGGRDPTDIHEVFRPPSL